MDTVAGQAQPIVPDPAIVELHLRPDSGSAPPNPNPKKYPQLPRGPGAAVAGGSSAAPSLRGAKPRRRRSASPAELAGDEDAPNPDVNHSAEWAGAEHSRLVVVVTQLRPAMLAELPRLTVRFSPAGLWPRLRKKLGAEAVDKALLRTRTRPQGPDAEPAALTGPPLPGPPLPGPPHPGPLPAGSVDGTPPTAAAAEARGQLGRLLRRHDAARLGEVDALLHLYAGDERRLFAALGAKYGIPEAELPGGTVPPAAAGCPRQCRLTAEEPEPAAGSGGGWSPPAFRGQLRLEVRAAAGLPHFPDGRDRRPLAVVVRYAGREAFRTPAAGPAEGLDATRRPVRLLGGRDGRSVEWPAHSGRALLDVDAAVATRVTLELVSCAAAGGGFDAASHSPVSEGFLGLVELDLRSLALEGTATFPLAPRAPQPELAMAAVAAGTRAQGGGLGQVQLCWGFVADAPPRPHGTLAAAAAPSDSDAPYGGGAAAADEDSPVSSPGAAAAAAAAAGRVRAMLSRYVPERAVEAAGLLAEHRGREAALLDVLVVRFGPEPGPAELRSRVERLLLRHDPARLPEAAALATQGTTAHSSIQALTHHSPLPPVFGGGGAVVDTGCRVSE